MTPENESQRPPPGEYLCKIDSLERNTDLTKGQPAWRFNLIVLTEGEHRGREVHLDYCCKHAESLQRLATLVRTMTKKEPPPNAVEVDALLNKFIGEKVRIRTFEYTRKRDGAVYRGLYVTEHYREPAP